MTRLSTWQGIAVLSLITAITWWASRESGEPKSRPMDHLDTRLNYALWDFNALMLDENGAINLQIDAPILRNNASSQIGTMENPRLRIQLEEDEWYITADSAIITADREFVSLIGRVDFLKQARDSSETLEIRTRDVLLNITPRTASTEAHVAIAQNSNHLEAVGMNLDLNTDSYELLEKVRASYATP